MVRFTSAAPASRKVFAQRHSVTRISKARSVSVRTEAGTRALQDLEGVEKINDFVMRVRVIGTTIFSVTVTNNCDLWIYPS